MKTEVGMIIAPDAPQRIVYPANGKKFSLAELQAAVEGNIELVRIRPGTARGMMYINEEGKLLGLLPNVAATQIALKTTLSARPSSSEQRTNRKEHKCVTS